MLIKTKIVATLGPASWDLPQVKRLAKAGADIFRLNFSHGTLEQHARSLAGVRAAGRQLGRPLAVMADLCGPKIRVGAVAGGSVVLKKGTELAIQRRAVVGTESRISTTLPELIDEVKRGDRLSCDDGRIQLEVIRTRAPREIVCRVTAGGELRASKGLNLPDTDLSLAALTEKDRRDAEWIAKQDIDYVALSFVQRAGDVEELRSLLAGKGSAAQVVAKIEKPLALENIDSIVEAADAVLVARGDLGVEMDLPEVPLAQKRLAELCRRAGKCCIVATQMLESMIREPVPTRAEVSDIANAVFDGADAVMLSGETAVGEYPVQAVEMMNSVCGRAEAYLAKGHQESLRRSDPDLAGTEHALVRAVHEIIHTDEIKAVAVFTMTGRTALLLAKTRLEVPVLALTPEQRVVRRACLYYGVQAERCRTPQHTRGVLAQAGRCVRRLKWAAPGQKIVVVSGRPLGTPGKANTIVIHTL